VAAPTPEADLRLWLGITLSYFSSLGHFEAASGLPRPPNHGLAYRAMQHNDRMEDSHRCMKMNGNKRKRVQWLLIFTGIDAVASIPTGPATAS
jgi:hypothetical protein